MNITPKRTLAAFAVGMGLIFQSISVQGVDYVWDDTAGSDALWTTTTNWDIAGTPGIADSVRFNDVGSTTIDLGAGQSIKQIYFGTTGVSGITPQTYTIGSGGAGAQELTLAGAGTIKIDKGNITQTIDANVTVTTGTVTLDHGYGGANSKLLINGEIKGVGTNPKIVVTGGDAGVTEFAGGLSDTAPLKYFQVNRGTAAISAAELNSGVTNYIQVGNGSRTGILDLSAASISNGIFKTFRIGSQAEAETGVGGAKIITDSNATNLILGTGTAFNTLNTIASGTDRVLELGGTGTGNNRINKPIIDSNATAKISLLKSGTGNWALSESSTYTGTTTITGGTLALRGDTHGNGEIIIDAASTSYLEIGSAGGSTLTSAITITESNANRGIRVLTGNTATISGNISSEETGNNSTVRLDVDGNLTVSGAIDTTGGGVTSGYRLALYGSGVVSLESANNFGTTGTLWVNEATTLRVENADATGGRPVRLNFAGATFEIGDGIIAQTQIQVNTGSGTVQVANGESGTLGKQIRLTAQPLSLNAGSAGLLTINGSAQIISIDDVATPVTKTGAGIVMLAHANNTYSGLTTVSEGTLLVNGTLAPAAYGGGSVTLDPTEDVTVTVNSGATLGGSGTIERPIVFEAGALFQFSETDTLTANGSTVDFGSNFGIDDLVGITSATPQATYTLIDGTSSIAASGDFDNLGFANALDLGSGVSAYFQSGSLEVVVVPEPGTIALYIGALAMGVVLYRRRRR